MTGNAVVTTRLSSVTMKSATEVMTNVQRVRLPIRSAIALPPFCVVSDYLLGRQKKGAFPSFLASLDQSLRPGLLAAEQVHGGDDVQQHAHSDEVPDPRRLGAGDALDVFHELAEVPAHDLTHLGVVAGDVGLELHAELRPILDELPVGKPDCLEGLLAPLAFGGTHERLDGEPEAAVHSSDEELLLRAEEPEE